MILLYASANIPSAFSTVYKEIGFESAAIDVNFMQWIVVMYQTLISFGFVPLQSIPYLSGSAEGNSLSSSWSDFVGGTQCFLGETPAGSAADLDCSRAGLLLLLYVVVNLLYANIGLILVKAGSEMQAGAVLRSLAGAVKLPVSTLLFSSTLLMGKNAEPTSIYTWAGMVLVAGGFIWHVKEGQNQAEETGEVDRTSVLPVAAGPLNRCPTIMLDATTPGGGVRNAISLPDMPLPAATSRLQVSDRSKTAPTAMR